MNEEKNINLEEIHKGNDGEIGEIKEKEPQLKSQIEIIKDSKEIATSILVREGDKTIELLELLPANVIYQVRNEGSPFSDYYYSWDNPARVSFPAREINTIDGRLAMLHEIGHAIYAEEHQEKHPPYDDLAILHFRIFEKYAKLSAAYKRTKPENRDKYLTKKFEQEMIKKDRNPYFKDQGGYRLMLFREIKLLFKHEREAWKEALKFRRKILQQKGIDLLANIDDQRIKKTLAQSFDLRLQTYDKYFTPEQQQEFVTFIDAIEV